MVATWLATAALFLNTSHNDSGSKMDYVMWFVFLLCSHAMLAGSCESMETCESKTETREGI